MIDSLNDQLLSEKKLTDDYKNQLAVLSCQVLPIVKFSVFILRYCNEMVDRLKIVYNNLLSNIFT